MDIISDNKEYEVGSAVHTKIFREFKTKSKVASKEFVMLLGQALHCLASLMESEDAPDYEIDELESILSSLDLLLS